MNQIVSILLQDHFDFTGVIVTNLQIENIMFACRCTYITPINDIVIKMLRRI